MPLREFGHAFPVATKDRVDTNGLTQRDFAAIMALQGILSRTPRPDAAHAAREAYQYVDALILASEDAAGEEEPHGADGDGPEEKGARSTASRK
jgi:hypothetical protein